MEFCSPFDEALARSGPAAVFLPDREGLLRFEASWTRDAWSRREPDAVDEGWRWVLLRDHDTGFVQIALATGALLDHHPRADVRIYADAAEAIAARAVFGRPPVSAAW